MTRPLRVLLFSTLYPSAQRPIHGIFVETRLRELLKTGQVDAKVVAPVPWFPFKGERFGEYGLFAATPKFEVRNGIEVHHPRYLLPPKVGMNPAPHLMALGALGTVRRLLREGFDFDLIDAHYYYPDGVAAGLLAKWLGKPFVVTARGTDINLIPQHAYPRRLILETAARASASIGVCQALMDTLRELGGSPEKLHTLRNGVDLERFQPEDRIAARERLKLPLDGRLLLSVGHLIERKGHHIAIEALTRFPPEMRLVIAGSGPERASLEKLAESLGLQSRVQFVGVIPQTELKWWYSAADVLILASSREGWANVLLEAMACGTPVVATRIWGTPEVVANDAVGRLVSERNGEAFADAISQLMASGIKRESVRAYAQGFGWQSTTDAQLALFDKLATRQG